MAEQRKSVKRTSPAASADERLIRLLEKQKRELVVRTLLKHEELEREKAFTEKLIGCLTDIVIALDGRLRVLDANTAFTRLLGHETRGRRRIPLERIVSPEHYPALEKAVRSGEVASLETELVASDGRRIPASVFGFPLEGDPGRPSFILVARDKTELFEMMCRVRESQMQVLHTDRLASLGEMAAGIAHELTQPLNAILLFAKNGQKALAADDDRALAAENLGLIVDRVNKASSIIRSLKGFARKSEEERAPVDVNALVRDVLRFLEGQVRLADVAVEVELAEDLPPVSARNIGLEQVLLNVLRNALQAMDKPDPRLAVRTCAVPDGGGRQRWARVSVEDNGVGMTPGVRSRIFDPFFTTREVGGGMGLGLSIVQRIVAEHEGRIEVASEPGRGTRFAVLLPLEAGGLRRADG